MQITFVKRVAAARILTRRRFTEEKTITIKGSLLVGGALRVIATLIAD